MEQPAPNNRQERLRTYTIPNPINEVRHQFTQVFIMLFGMLGHGKSSLINSCICVLKDCIYQNVAGIGNTDFASTIARNQYELTQTLSMVDNRGFNKMNACEMLEATAQLRSLRNIGDVTWENNYMETLQQFITNMTAPRTAFFVPVLVISAETPLSGADFSSLSSFVTDTFRITGIHPILVITKENSTNTGHISKKFCDLGITHRITLENYTTNNTHRNPETDKKILKFLETCISEAERGIQINRPDHFIRQGQLQLGQEINTHLGMSQSELNDLRKKNEELEKKNKNLEQALQEETRIKEKNKDCAIL